MGKLDTASDKDESKTTSTEPAEAAQGENPSDAKTEEAALTEQAEAAYKTLKAGEELPKDTPPAVKLLARQMKMGRDTQGAYTKTNQQLIAAQAERDALKAIAEQAPVSLTSDQQTELDDLKYSDPDAWRAKLNEYEEAAKQGTATQVTETMTTAAEKAVAAARLKQLKEFTANSGIELTDEIIENDLPPRITSKLSSGEITFAEFLEQAERFLTADKTIDKSNPEGEGTTTKTKPSFDTTSGSGDPSNPESNADFAHQYGKNAFDF